jgi:hypothetical protein
MSSCSNKYVICIKSEIEFRTVSLIKGCRVPRGMHNLVEVAGEGEIPQIIFRLFARIIRLNPGPGFSSHGADGFA